MLLLNNFGCPTLIRIVFINLLAHCGYFINHTRVNKCRTGTSEGETPDRTLLMQKAERMIMQSLFGGIKEGIPSIMTFTLSDTPLIWPRQEKQEYADRAI